MVRCLSQKVKLYTEDRLKPKSSQALYGRWISKPGGYLSRVIWKVPGVEAQQLQPNLIIETSIGRYVQFYYTSYKAPMHYRKARITACSTSTYYAYGVGYFKGQSSR